MRRADRLFEIIQILRRSRMARAQDMAEKLEVSERTIYRDIADLVSSGVPIDGDHMIGIAALHMAETGALTPPLVVTTVMSNLGLETRLAEQGIGVTRTPVGDRHVSEAMSETSSLLGGEPSGHVIFSEYAATGDGILTAVKLLEIAHREGTGLEELARSIPLFPQVLRNVPCTSPVELVENEEVREQIAQAKAQLGAQGQLLVRPSGTQPLVRILVEASDKAECERIADRIEAALRDAQG